MYVPPVRDGGWFMARKCWWTYQIRRDLDGWLSEEECYVPYETSWTFSPVDVTKKGALRARFMYREGRRRETMSLTFGGTDESADWFAFNFRVWKKKFTEPDRSKYSPSNFQISDYAYHNTEWDDVKDREFHAGYVKAMEMLETCVNKKRHDLYYSEGIKLATMYV